MNDLLITDSSSINIKVLDRTLNRKSQMSDLKPGKYYLGMIVTCNKRNEVWRLG